MRYRYPKTAMVGDYFRGGIGTSSFVLPMLIFELPPASVYICLALASLFGVHLLQTVGRHRTRIEMNEHEIHNAGNSSRLAWNDLSRVALRYFTVRRDGESGWMELELTSGRRSIRLDSRIEGFEHIAAQAARAAAENGLEMDRATLDNFDALGVRLTACGGTRG
ncbi:MAG: hypothetical protein R3174_15095 [Gammaproteobacteria bacterium]|nr:hypothetical protein [Gammaproteobacteria bacterium]